MTRFLLAIFLYIIGGCGIIPLHRFVINESVANGCVLSLLAILSVFFFFPFGLILVLFKMLYEGDLIMKYEEPLKKPKVDVKKLLEDEEEEKENLQEDLHIKCNIDKTICIEDYDITLNLNKEKDLQTFLSILDCEFEQERNKYAQELSDKLKNAKTEEDFDEVNKQIDKWQRMRG